MRKESTIKMIFHYVKPYLFLLIVSFILSVVSVYCALFVPIRIGSAIDCIVDQGLVDMPMVIQYLTQTFILIGINTLSVWIMTMINQKVTYLVVKDIRVDAFSKIETLPISYLDKNPVGSVVSRVISDIDTFADGLLMGFSQFFTGILTILGTLYLMFSIQTTIALIVVILTPLSIVVANFIASKTYSMFKLQSETRATQTAYIDEMIGNLKVVQAFDHQQPVIHKFESISDEYEKHSLRAMFFSSMTNPATRFVNNLVYAAVALAGAFHVAGGSLTVGMLTCFLSYANQYGKPFNEISSVITELQNALACAGRVFELLVVPSEISDEEGIIMEKAEGQVCLDNISFSYTKNTKLLDHISLNVKQGEKIAIVGPTGCGKTTLINLLMRFYDVDSGSILIDGVDIRKLKRHSLRSQFGMVLQDTWLKSGTIKENIIMGKKDATMEEILEASKKAHSYEFIRRLPQGFDTVINEGGDQLSQGQKQLLCITRVMLALPPMLILDEATSSIDTRTEMQIQEAFDNLMKGRTCFIVAHRLSTIQSADLILVMKDGNIIEQGKHQELLDKGGYYATLYESQFAH